MTRAPQPGAATIAAAAVTTMRALAPHRRSITGEGLRATLRAIDAVLPLTLTEVPSGTRVLDWEVPAEWQVREAWIRDAAGRPVVDYADHPLHLVNYSRPFRGRLSRAALDRHLHSLPAQPDWIPYRTAYYSDTWGFCLSDSVRRALPDGEYEICVDAELRDGSLTFGEAVLPGRSADEFLISTHACHPAMVNDNLTGLAVVAHVAAALAQRPRRLTYRFLFAPGTIGAIAWLASRREVLPRIRHGLVVGLLGHAGPLHYKQSRRGDRRIDAYGAQLVRERPGAVLEPYSPYGYDERQFCSPGFDLPVGRLTRTPHGAYPEYHTSADDFARLDAAALEDSVAALLDVIEMAETDAAWRNVRPEGEPRLGVHGLYRAVGGTAPDPAEQALLWVLAYADGETPLLEIAARSGHCYGDVVEAVERLAAAGLVARERFPGGDE